MQGARSSRVRDSEQLPELWPFVRCLLVLDPRIIGAVSTRSVDRSIDDETSELLLDSHSTWLVHLIRKIWR